MPSDTALLIAHEIWGVNDHITGAADHFGRVTGFDVLAASYLSGGRTTAPPGEDAYRMFQESPGIDGMAARIATDAERLRRDHAHVHCIGFSVGATATWLLAQQGLVDRAACIYGSRIRDHLSPEPASPTLVMFAETEASFTPRSLLPQLATTAGVTAVVLDETTHGYCNPDSPAYDALATERTYELATDFLRSGC